MKRLSILTLCMFSSFVFASEITINMNEVNNDGVAKSVGTIAVTESEHGLIFTPNLTNLAPGIHGFHIHTNPDCGATAADGTKGPAMAAGGHFDPTDSKKHGTPWGDGHLGDLPPLFVNNDGIAQTPVLAPRIKALDTIKNHAIMIHVDGDNFSDNPKPLGGGGARAACGIIQ